MAKKILTLTLIFITLLAIFARFYRFSSIPSGFVNDEASIGYNAYSILKTGKDEFGNFLPLSFRSFGDYKLPVYVYLTIPSILIFGLTELAVRFPSALFGFFTIPLAFLLVQQLLIFKKQKSSTLALITSLVLATMPWHIHFSRAAFEANLSLFFIMAAGLFWLKFIISKKNQPLIYSLALFLIATFTYHAPRVFVPLWLSFLIIYFYPAIKKQLKATLVLSLIIIILPLSLVLLSKNSLSRASGISIFHQQSGVQADLHEKFLQSPNQALLLTRILHNKLESYSREFLQRYASHFDPQFLFFTGDPLRPRYRSPDVGQTLLVFLPFFLTGLYQAIRQKHFFILSWFLLGPIPAALTFETPSSIRALLMVFPLSFIIGLGLQQTSLFLKKIKQPCLKNSLIAVFTLCFIYNFAYYLDAYFIHAPVDEPYEWQGGYQQLVAKVAQLAPNYQKIIITNQRSTPYIFFLFYHQYAPVKWQQQANQHLEIDDKFNFIKIKKLDNLEFVNHPCPAANDPQPNILYVCTDDGHPNDLITQGAVKIIDTVHYDDQTINFVLMEKI